MEKVALGVRITLYRAQNSVWPCIDIYNGIARFSCISTAFLYIQAYCRPTYICIRTTHPLLKR